MGQERVTDEGLWEVEGERKKMSTESFQEGFREGCGIWAQTSKIGCCKRGETMVIVEGSSGSQGGMHRGQREAGLSMGKSLVSLKHNPCRGIMEDKGRRQAEALS